MALKLDVCPMFGDPCRHVSFERTRHPFTKLKKANGIFAPESQGVAIHELGAYCNNECAWVESMKRCPIRWQNANSPNKPIQKWKVVHDGNTLNRQRIESVGQQKLNV